MYYFYDISDLEIFKIASASLKVIGNSAILYHFQDIWR